MSNELGELAPRNAAGWHRLAAVYRPAAGEMSRHVFLRACEEGAIPVTVRAFGRFLYVNVAEFDAWRSPAARGAELARDATRANANLFE